MIRSLEIKSFRGMASLSLNNLSRVNVVVGPNASGKSALLEAILLGCRASPLAAVAMWQTRSQTPIIPIGLQGFQAVWSGFFPNLDMRRSIEIEYIDSELGRRALRINPHKAGPIPASRHARRALAATSAKQPKDDGLPIEALDFERVEARGAVTHSFADMTPQGNLNSPNALPLGPAVANFGSTAQYLETDNMQWLSSLTVDNREGEVLDLLRQEYPSIETVDILSPVGLQGIYVSYKGIEKKLPINIVSSGIQKVLTLILASLSYKKGVILLDEFENGLFYKRYSDVWNMVHSLAVKYDNQIFTTSHSIESLKAALPAIQKSPEDFSLIRMERDDNGIIAKRFSGREFAAVLEEDLDPRGIEAVPNAAT